MNVLLKFSSGCVGKHSWVMFVNCCIRFSIVFRLFCGHLLSLAELEMRRRLSCTQSPIFIYSSAIQHVMSRFNYLTPTMFISCSGFCMAPSSEFLLEKQSVIHTTDSVNGLSVCKKRLKLQMRFLSWL